MKLRIFYACLLLISFGALTSAARDSGNSGTQSKHPSNVRSIPADPGERVFAANCARCHVPPTSLRPRITGTVLMHMRVRARLSKEDEKALIRYMAP
jgi:cytochrome c5